MNLIVPQLRIERLARRFGILLEIPPPPRFRLISFRNSGDPTANRFSEPRYRAFFGGEEARFSFAAALCRDIKASYTKTSPFFVFTSSGHPWSSGARWVRRWDGGSISQLRPGFHHGSSSSAPLYSSSAIRNR